MSKSSSEEMIGNVNIYASHSHLLGGSHQCPTKAPPKRSYQDGADWFFTTTLVKNLPALEKLIHVQ